MQTISKKGVNVELGLAAIMKHRDPTQEIEQSVIADICGVSRTYIQHIEYQAIKKLREKGLTPVIMEWRNER